MIICVPLSLEFMQQVTAVKGIIWKAARNRSSVCGQMPIIRERLLVLIWQGEMLLIKEISFTISPIL